MGTCVGVCYYMTEVRWAMHFSAFIANSTVSHTAISGDRACGLLLIG